MHPGCRSVLGPLLGFLKRKVMSPERYGLGGTVSALGIVRVVYASTLVLHNLRLTLSKAECMKNGVRIVRCVPHQLFNILLICTLGFFLRNCFVMRSDFDP